MYIFDESDIYFRSPGGALKTPGTITLQIKLRRGEASNPRACLYPDGSVANETVMVFQNSIGAYDLYKAELKFEEPGLYWYYFLIDAVHDSYSFTVPEHYGGGFQITAYSPDKGSAEGNRRQSRPRSLSLSAQGIFVLLGGTAYAFKGSLRRV